MLLYTSCSIQSPEVVTRPENSDVFTRKSSFMPLSWPKTCATSYSVRISCSDIFFPSPEHIRSTYFSSPSLFCDAVTMPISPLSFTAKERILSLPKDSFLLTWRWLSRKKSVFPSLTTSAPSAHVFEQENSMLWNSGTTEVRYTSPFSSKMETE